MTTLDADALRQQKAAEYARKKAEERERLRPLPTRISNKLRPEAEFEVMSISGALDKAVIGWLLGDVEDAEVERLERELEAAERLLRRYDRARQEIDRRTGVIRDSNGTVLGGVR